MGPSIKSSIRGPEALIHENSGVTELFCSTAGVSLEVVRRTLGHASLGTTSIYVSPEEARMRREAAKYHARVTRDA